MLRVSSVSLGRLIRRKRTERRLSQKALATALGTSQALVSYYESGRVMPSADVLERLGGTLGFTTQDLQRAAAHGEGRREAPPPAGMAGLPRSAFLRTLSVLPGRVATFDQPAGEDGGDLAFAVDLRSHAYLVLIDAEGSGPASSPMARLAAACAFGATVLPGGGVVPPEDIVDATLRFWQVVGTSPRSAAMTVVSFDRRKRLVRQCRLDMPTPFVRSGRLAQWTGKPSGPAGSFVGEMEMAADALLLFATDGVANVPTKGDRALWSSPDLRSFLGRVTDPADVVAMLKKRAREPAAGERSDDRLAIAVMP